MSIEEIGEKLIDLQIHIGAYRAEVTSQNTITNDRLEKIDNHLQKLNGKVAQHEKLIQQGVIDEIIRKEGDARRKETCPLLDDVHELKTNYKIRISLKQAIVGFVGFLAILLSITFTSIKIAQHMLTPNNQEQTD